MQLNTTVNLVNPHRDKIIEAIKANALSLNSSLSFSEFFPGKLAKINRNMAIVDQNSQTKKVEFFYIFVSE